jgi:hypothetical protein
VQFRPVHPKGLSMLDLLYIAIGLAGFAVCVGYVRLCEFL